MEEVQLRKMSHLWMTQENIAAGGGRYRVGSVRILFPIAQIIGIRGEKHVREGRYEDL